MPLLLIQQKLSYLIDQRQLEACLMLPTLSVIVRTDTVVISSVKRNWRRNDSCLRPLFIADPSRCFSDSLYQGRLNISLMSPSLLYFD